MSHEAQRDRDPLVRNVLVPLDGSSRAAGAVPVARAVATRFGATIHTITVAADDDVGNARARAARSFDTEPDDPRIHVAVATDVAAAIQQCAAALDPCLVCLSTHGRGRVAATLVGSTARDVIRRSGEPVVVTGPAVAGARLGRAALPTLGVDRLVACVDGSPRSDRVLRGAAAWAHVLDMKLTIVTVAEPCPPPSRLGTPWRRHHGPDEDADEYVRRLGERWAFEAAGVETYAVYDPISPAAGIRDHLAARPAGLIAVGCQLRRSPEHVVLGSAAADIVRMSPVPAIVLPGI